jgi:hypothetical protein
MQPAENGRTSIGKRSRHLNIKYFFITDLINRKQVNVKFCPTDGMLADYMSKSLTGRKFRHYRSLIMNLPPNQRQSPQECVGASSPANESLRVPKKKRQIESKPTADVKYRPRKVTINKNSWENQGNNNNNLPYFFILCCNSNVGFKHCVVG